MQNEPFASEALSTRKKINWDLIYVRKFKNISRPVKNCIRHKNFAKDRKIPNKYFAKFHTSEISSTTLLLIYLFEYVILLPLVFAICTLKLWMLNAI
jgi:hypothetical protein